MLSLNKVSLLLLMLMILSVTGCGQEDRDKAKQEVATTDLSLENMDGIELGMVLDEENVVPEHGRFRPLPDNAYYASQRNHDQYWNGRFILSIERETREILQISTLEDNNISSSAKGIKVGATMDDVVATYGEDYYSYDDKEQTIYVIGYVDHLNNVELFFTHYNDKVTGIRLGYAFERIKWEN